MKYRVTCNGMFIAGALHRKGQVFEMDDDNVEKMRTRTPHLTFEAVDDKGKRTVDAGPNDGSDGDKTTAQLPRGRGKGKGAKKRGA